MTAVAVQRNPEQRPPSEYTPSSSSQPGRQQPTQGHKSSASGPPTLQNLPNEARSQTSVAVNGRARTNSIREAANSRSARGANGAVPAAQDDAMQNQQSDITPTRGNSVTQLANGSSHRRIDTLVGGNMNARRRNQSSCNLAQQNGGNESNNSPNGVAVRSRRAGAPGLQRSKSDYGPRKGEEHESDTENDVHEWGSRHGFDEHYASPEYVSQLATTQWRGIILRVMFAPLEQPDLDRIFGIYPGSASYPPLCRENSDGLPSSPPSMAKPNAPLRPKIGRSKSTTALLEGVLLVHRESEEEDEAAINLERHLSLQSSIADYGQYANGEFQNWFMYFTEKRHQRLGNPDDVQHELQDWRMKDRLKTVSAALAVCLNIGVEPPDQMRTTPGAKLEAWVDPTSMQVQKALETIGKSLQAQYETLAIRTRYKQYLDPSVDETKKFCISLRRNAKEERVLFHYNGHGVPKPTASGEIWVFNRNYTQYIPVSLYDLQQWLQAPTFYVWDCSDAGNILANFHRFVEKHEQEEAEVLAKDPGACVPSYRPYIHLAATGVKESLPTNPALPADVFTCCLTTPIEMALWFFCLQNPLGSKGITPERAKKMPGRLQERRTPLGELNWIFTAITDTIAWTTLPRPVFRKFFRQDLMVAALFRNFLLAQRVMHYYGCHPQSYPELPDTHMHPLWESWDLAVDMALAQLPMLEEKEQGIRPDYEFVNSSFFTEQLTAFDVYLSEGALTRKPPDQLPVVLQVLLSQQHRVRALVLLGKFLDMGPWAVNLALSIGIFPYVLKLLQSVAHELKPIMIFIWTRVLAVDISCQQDLLKDSGYNYFSSMLKPNEAVPVVDTGEHKAMCAFILAQLCNGYKQGQNVCNQTDIMSSCLQNLESKHGLLKQWSCLCISQLWNDLPEAKWRGIRENAHLKLTAVMRDDNPEVRSAMVYAMTTFLGIPEITNEVERIEELITWTIMDLALDGCAMVRKELICYASKYVSRYENKFLVAAFEHLKEDKEILQFPPKEDGSENKLGLHYARPAHRNPDSSINESAHGVSHNSVYAYVWKQLVILSGDPHPEVQKNATITIDYIHQQLLDSPLASKAQSLIDDKVGGKRS